MNKHYYKRTRRTRGRTQAEIDIELLKKTLKKISSWKTPGHDGIYGFLF